MPHSTWSIRNEWMENYCFILIEIFLCCIMLGKTEGKKVTIILSVVYAMLLFGDMLWFGDMWPGQLHLSDRYYPFLAPKDVGILVNNLSVGIESHTNWIACKQKLFKRCKQTKTDPFNLVLLKKEQKGICLRSLRWSTRITICSNWN